MSGKFMRGALVHFMETVLIPIPNVIVFQYNPEQMVHTWTQPQSAEGSNPLAVRGLPTESFNFTIQMSARDMIADGSVIAEGIASVSGVYSRLAALEMLQYPSGASTGGLLGSLSASVSVGAGGISFGGSASAGVSRSVPQAQVPTVLFVWGPGRIVPVRVTGLTITENLYDALLNPIQADAVITLKVLTPEELAAVRGPLAEIAKGSYKYTQTLREALAILNLANAVESIIGMLPI
jgi:hypothetical protein